VSDTKKKQIGLLRRIKARFEINVIGVGMRTNTSYFAQSEVQLMNKKS